ncbi:hypothetical protein SCHPADRAFT_948350 [Schizopora paradoxa]|uniref:Uncharacterized protein n=1 Tax=Schizopora paradoxa TaxID=27342 RepID=A0A0H2QXT8_9AGAM|nr:hypothetical protein SCHPADRAFT_948350 [Schizopora paradoxa]
MSPPSSRALPQHPQRDATPNDDGIYRTRTTDVSASSLPTRTAEGYRILAVACELPSPSHNAHVLPPSSFEPFHIDISPYVRYRDIVDGIERRRTCSRPCTILFREAAGGGVFGIEGAEVVWWCTVSCDVSSAGERRLCVAVAVAVCKLSSSVAMSFHVTSAVDDDGMYGELASLRWSYPTDILPSRR